MEHGLSIINQVDVCTYIACAREKQHQHQQRQQKWNISKNYPNESQFFSRKIIRQAQNSGHQ